MQITTRFHRRIASLPAASACACVFIPPRLPIPPTNIFIYKARLFCYITILLKKTASNIICIQSFWAAYIQLFFSIELVYFFALINIVKAAQHLTAAWNSFTKHFGKNSPLHTSSSPTVVHVLMHLIWHLTVIFSYFSFLVGERSTSPRVM
jgi:hypothetical protein